MNIVRTVPRNEVIVVPDNNNDVLDLGVSSQILSVLTEDNLSVEIFKPLIIETVAATGSEVVSPVVNVPPVEATPPLDPIPLLPPPMKAENAVPTSGVPVIVKAKDVTPRNVPNITFIPFSEKLETIAIWRIKNALTLFTLKRRFYLYHRNSNKKFYWDVRDKETPRTSSLHGPFDTREEAYKDMSKYFDTKQDGLERLE